MANGRRLLLVHHFFHPDEVVSARLYAQLAEELAARGWRVTVLTSNRTRRAPDVELPPRETWQGIEIVRAFRPPWPQARPVPRLASSAWLLGAWSAALRGLGPFDAVLLGTDPAFAPLLAIPLRALLPNAVLGVWCFDLYPEAIAADASSPRSRAASLVPLARALMKRAYARCDLIADLGPAMRARLDAYAPRARRETFPPWSLLEPTTPRPPDPRVRARLFPPGTELALLYAGTLGRAHDFRPFLELARRCRARSGNTIAFTFAGAGHRRPELERALLPSDTNVRLADACPEAELLDRLEAADVHLVSVRENWDGIVLPAKFFGALAVGRPVLSVGPAAGDIARWTREHDVGFAFEGDERGIEEAVAWLHAAVDDRARLRRWGENAWRGYRERFARGVVCGRVEGVLREMVEGTG